VTVSRVCWSLCVRSIVCSVIVPAFHGLVSCLQFTIRHGVHTAIAPCKCQSELVRTSSASKPTLRCVALRAPSMTADTPGCCSAQRLATHEGLTPCFAPMSCSTCSTHKNTACMSAHVGFAVHETDAGLDTSCAHGTALTAICTHAAKTGCMQRMKQRHDLGSHKS
jgi:hypothetical protein